MNTITSALPQEHPWGKSIYYYDSLPSTNTLAKELALQGAPEGTVIIAGHQSAGRGRLGRSFSSPESMGLYLSVILRPNCKPGELMHLTCAAGLAACDAICDTTQLQCGIKWANDLVWQRKKLGGILTELGFDSQGNVAWAVVGIGINCAQQAQDFPEEIRSIATSLTMVTGEQIDRRALAAALILCLKEMNDGLHTPGPAMERYRSRCVTIGQAVSVHRFQQIEHGKAIGVDDTGAIIVEFSDGHAETIATGEVSIRGMYGYV